MPTRMFNCARCNSRASSNHNHAKYCSTKCRQTNSCTNKGYDSSGLATGTVGSISELLVCADLLKKKYEVFRSVSSHCSCDLIAYKAGITYRIEVRTGYFGVGKRYLNRKHRADVLAGVFGSEIVYEPPFDVLADAPE